MVKIAIGFLNLLRWVSLTMAGILVVLAGVYSYRFPGRNSSELMSIALASLVLLILGVGLYFLMIAFKDREKNKEKCEELQELERRAENL